ncbi:MAG TPA: DUF6285 domain-containing protein [Candidatus Binatia bacterium]|jgi:hypothetical protein|nr:DUF6285 domain-containing protein [Candidatus Binatia bacterium]
MQDRPTVPEFLKAVTQLLDEELVPNLSGSRQFYARVAANVLRMVRRELEHEEEDLAAEWQRLDALLPPVERPATRAELREAIRRRTEELCQRIRQGDADTGPYRDQVLAHVRETVREKLLVSNPGWLKRFETEI